MRAGTQTISSSSPRTNCTCARPTASTATRCPVTICGSARTECEPAGRATRPTSVPSGSATPAGTTLARNPHSLRYVNRSADAASSTARLMPPLPRRAARCRASGVPVLSHAIWSTSHLNWTNPRACLTQLVRTALRHLRRLTETGPRHALSHVIWSAPPLLSRLGLDAARQNNG
jgi:hypothetical protein